jgi:hypothetical protein
MTSILNGRLVNIRIHRANGASVASPPILLTNPLRKPPVGWMPVTFLLMTQPLGTSRD